MLCELRWTSRNGGGHSNLTGLWPAYIVVHTYWMNISSLILCKKVEDGALEERGISVESNRW